MSNQLVFKPLAPSFDIQLHMHSDWHIGSGVGRPGDVDRLVRRDEDDLPFIPAKTLLGIWRDACERAAWGLDDRKIMTTTKNGQEMVIGWSAWIPVLFGDQAGQLDEDRPDLTEKEKEEEKKERNRNLELPRPAIISVRSARFPESLRKAIKAQPAAKDAVTFVKPGVEIDPRSGRAKEDFLRFEELARGGVELTAQCQVHWERYNWEDDGQKLAAAALLLAGTKLVERIGAKRRRGAGKCEMTIVEGADLDACWEWIESLNNAEPPSPPAAKQSEEVASPATNAAEGWACIDLLIETKSPVIIAEQAVGNLVKTLDYIPGTSLLPILRDRLRKTFDVNRAIYEGNLTVTNATVEIADSPGRPVPFALFHEKVGGGLKLGSGVYNRLCESAPDRPQLKGHRAGYVGPSPETDTELPDFETVTLEVEPHNVVQDNVQRPTEVVGGVYSYQVIAKGTKLRAQLRVRKSVLPSGNENWFAPLNENSSDYTIGRSRKDDYGSVKLTASVATQKVAIPESENELTVWLLSDLLLRDERLRPTASILRLADVLGDKLGVKLSPRDARDASDKKLMSAVSRQRRTDSWHVGWGLPRPSLVGLAAGTCIVFKVTGDKPKADKLAEVAAEGLGERRAEGYGRLCFNDPLLATSAKKRQRLDNPTPNGKPPLEPIKKDDPSYDYAQLIEHEAARKELKRCAMGLAADPTRRELALGIYVKTIDGQPKSEPTPSQLITLRAALTRLKEPGDKTILQWLNHLEQKREDKWPAGRKGEEHSLHKIRNLITDAECVWTKLGVDFDQLALTENGAASLKEKLWAEAVRTLVDACIRAQKRETEKGGRANGTQS